MTRQVVSSRATPAGACSGRSYLICITHDCTDDSLFQQLGAYFSIDGGATDEKATEGWASIYTISSAQKEAEEGAKRKVIKRIAGSIRNLYLTSLDQQPAEPYGRLRESRDTFTALSIAQPTCLSYSLRPSPILSAALRLGIRKRPSCYAAEHSRPFGENISPVAALWIPNPVIIASESSKLHIELTPEGLTIMPGPPSHCLGGLRMGRFPRSHVGSTRVRLFAVIGKKSCAAKTLKPQNPAVGHGHLLIAHHFSSLSLL